MFGVCTACAHCLNSVLSQEYAVSRGPQDPDEAPQVLAALLGRPHPHLAQGAAQLRHSRLPKDGRRQRQTIALNHNCLTERATIVRPSCHIAKWWVESMV